VAAFTFLSYVFIYTPLKRKTPLNTLVGAVPGALPPVIGWTAIRGSIDREALALFLIVFLWQVPHFLAIAWIYREQYARAGLCMLPVVDPDGTQTGRQMVRYCLVLIPASLVPAGLDMAGGVYIAAAVLLGLGFLLRCIAFTRESSVAQARRVLRASLVYLPLLFLLLLLDGRAAVGP
jgi:protoheme IX farnesyltransferase